MNFQSRLYLKINSNQEKLTSALSNCHRNEDDKKKESITSHIPSNKNCVLGHKLQPCSPTKIHRQKCDPKWFTNKQIRPCFCCYNITHSTFFFFFPSDVILITLFWNLTILNLVATTQYSHYMDSFPTFQLARLLVSVLWSYIMDKRHIKYTINSNSRNSFNAFHFLNKGRRTGRRTSPHNYSKGLHGSSFLKFSEPYFWKQSFHITTPTERQHLISCRASQWLPYYLNLQIIRKWQSSSGQ